MTPATPLAENRHAAVDRRWWLVVAVVVAAFALINIKLLDGRGAPIWDAEDQFTNYWALVADAARAGRLAWWDPMLSGGTPQAAEPQHGVFSPTQVGMGLLLGGSMRSYCVYWLCVWLMGGLGMMALARRLGAPAWGAAVVTMGWLFCGGFLGNASHLPFVLGYSTIPWFFWRLEVGLTQRGIRPWAEAGAIWGLSGLSAYPALTILTPCLGALWIAGRIALPDAANATPASPSSEPSADRPSRRSAAIRAAGGLAIILAVGVVVLAPLMVSIAVEGRSFSARLGERDRAESISSNMLAPGALSAFASPYVPSVRGANPTLWPATDVTLVGLYSGVSIYTLAILALWRRRDRPVRWWALALAALALLLALGSHTPLRGWLYDWFPPSRYFRHAAIFRIYALFLLALLACWGLAVVPGVGGRKADEGEPIPHDHSCQTWQALLVVCILGALSIVTLERLVRSVSGQMPELAAARWHLWIMWPILAVIVLGMTRVHTTRARQALVVAWLALSLADAAWCQGLSRTVHDDRPATMERWHKLAQGRRAEVDLTTIGLARVMRVQLGSALTTQATVVKVPAWESYVTLLNPFVDRWLDDPMLNGAVLQPGPQPPPGQSRLWFAAQAVEVTPTLAHFDSFRAAANRSGGLPAVIHRAQDMPLRADVAAPLGATTRPADDALALAPIATRLPARVLTHQLDRLALAVHAEREGWLFVTDRWCAGWSARVNHQPAPLRPAMFLFRAVRIPAGDSVVELEYRNPAWPWALGLSWGCLALIACWSLLRAWRHRRSPERADAPHAAG